MIACSYGGLVLCRAALPLVSGSAYVSCGWCRTNAKNCTGGLGEEWQFDIDDVETPGILRVAKILVLFTRNQWTKKAEREVVGEKAFDILRSGMCHGIQGVQVDGEEAPTHVATANAEIVNRLVFPHTEKKTVGKGKGKET